MKYFVLEVFQICYSHDFLFSIRIENDEIAEPVRKEGAAEMYRVLSEDETVLANRS